MYILCVQITNITFLSHFKQLYVLDFFSYTIKWYKISESDCMLKLIQIFFPTQTTKNTTEDPVNFVINCNAGNA